MEPLQLTSCQAPNADATCRAIATYLGRYLKRPTPFVDDMPWQERERLLDAGHIAAGWICGLPYVRKAGVPHPSIELLAAPVMQGARYQDQPIYFSDVVVHRDSPFRSFADLRGCSWAYNEPGSQSGYGIVRCHLATLGETAGYFGRAIESGAHEESLRMILARHIDASAIDSTVLETALRRRPDLEARLHIVETLGPSPIPPWVVSKRLAPDVRDALRETMLNMHRHPHGRAILDEGRIARFVAVADQDYDVIRHMAHQAERVRL